MKWRKVKGENMKIATTKFIRLLKAMRLLIQIIQQNKNRHEVPFLLRILLFIVVFVTKQK